MKDVNKNTMQLLIEKYSNAPIWGPNMVAKDYGKTHVKVNGDIIEISHYGNAENHKNHAESFDSNLKGLGYGSLERLKSRYIVLGETGSVDEIYQILLKEYPATKPERYPHSPSFSKYPRGNGKHYYPRDFPDGEN